LSFWQANDLLRDSITRFRVIEDVVKDAKQDRAAALRLVTRFRKARKSKEAKQSVAVLRKVNRLLGKAKGSLKAKSKGIRAVLELLAVTEKRFACESIAALRHGDFKAFNALERLWKRWNSGDRQSDHRSLGLLELLRKKALKTAWSKGGGATGYYESAVGGDRVLSDAEWPKLTAREIHSHLVAVKAFLPPQSEERLNEQLHQVRRLVRGMGMKLMPDRRGRKPRSKNRN
jgi:hypothetical protein